MLEELARWSGETPAAALERAVKERYDRAFWEAVNTGYAALQADGAAWAEEQAERKLWESTLADGLDPAERWGEDGKVQPSEQDRAS
jgi:hypothetical protein